MRLLVVLLLAFVTGCVTSRFTPWSVQQARHEPIAKSAVLVRPGDLEALGAAGGVVIGTLEAEGAPAASFDRVDAATYGATHILVGAQHSELVRVTPTTGSTYCSGDSCHTTVTPGATGRRKHVLYTLIRVERAAWAKLPPILRPAKNG